MIFNKLILATLGLLTFNMLSGIFDFNITAMNGAEQSLSAYSGKRIMIVVLPVTHTASDSAMLIDLDSLSRKYQDSITMIGIPSYEYGYNPDSIQALKNWYESMLDSQFVLARGMYTRKASASQNDLFAWLTNEDQNGHFDDDVAGPGQKFFISKDGNLYASATPNAEMTEQIFKHMLKE